MSRSFTETDKLTRRPRDIYFEIYLASKRMAHDLVKLIYDLAVVWPKQLTLSLVKPPKLFFGAESGLNPLYRPDLRNGDLVEVILRRLSYFQPDTGNQFIEGAATPFGAQMGFPLGLKFNGSRGEGLMQYLGHHPMMPTWFTFRQGDVTYSLPKGLISSIRKISMSQIP